MGETVEKAENWDKVLKFLEPKAPLYCPHTPYPKQKAFLRSESLEVLFGGSAGPGKAVTVNTVTITPNGWTTIGELKPGDFVFDENGDPTEVLAKSEILLEDTYEVEMTDGEIIIAGENHYWNVANERQRANYQHTNPSWQAARRAKRASRAKENSLKPGTGKAAEVNNSKRAQEARENKVRPSIWDYTSILTTKQMIELQKTERKRISIPNAKPLVGTGDWKSDVTPYVLGAWLGDGCSANGYIYCAESDLAEFSKELESDGWKIEILSTRAKEGLQDFHLLKLSNKNDEKLVTILRREGFLQNKHIPDWIVHTSFADRQAFLGGLCDTDGYVNQDGTIEFCMAREQMVRDTQMLFWSIGCSPTPVKHKVTTNQDPNFKGDAWRFEVSQCSEYIFRLPRKRQILHEINKDKTVDHSEYRSIKEIRQVARVPMQCIQVASPRGLFRVGRTFLTTHNSDSLLMAALQYVDVPGYSAMLFRNSLADLDLPGALMDRARDWWKEYPDVRFSAQKNQATFPSGATITFGYLQDPDSHLRYKGMECQFLGFDEVTEIREQHYRYLLTRLRKPSIESGLPLAHVPIRARCASNPAPNWVRRYFIEEGEKEGRLYIPAFLSDNPYVNQEAYRDALRRASAVDRARLEFGDWYAEESGEKFDREDFSIISPDDVPDEAYKNCVRYWDLAATEVSDQNPDPDWTVGLKASIVNGYIFILDVKRFRSNSDGVERKILQTAMEDGPEVKIRMEKDPGQAGKPVSIYSQVQMADGSIKLLKDVKVGDYVITHTGSSQLVSAYHKQGVLDGVRITTKTGRSIEVANDHPIFTPVGWVNGGDLAEGEFIGLLNGYQINNTPQERSNEEARFIGYFLGDGCCVADKNDSSISASITAIDEVERLDIEHCATTLGFKYRYDGKSYHFSGGVRDWLRDVGLAGKNAFSKRVPDFIYAQNNEYIANLVGAYFACDGTIAKDQKCAEFYSVSKELLQDIQKLLSRLGIYSELREKTGRYQETKHMSWRLYVPVNKSDALRKLKLTLPIFNQTKMDRMIDVRTVNEFFGPYVSDRIEKIEKIEVECACLTVEEDHTFLISDVIVHNSQISHYGRNVLLGFDFDGNPVNKNKEARLDLWAPKVKRGEFKLVRGDWISNYLDEVVAFGSLSVHDDQCDATSGAFEILTNINNKKKNTVKIIV